MKRRAVMDEVVEPLKNALRKKDATGASYKPNFKFPKLGAGKRRMRWAVEVEVEHVSNRSFGGYDYLEAVPSEWAAKYDGTLRNGAEFVVRHPFTSLEQGITAVENLDDYLADDFDAEKSCGLHVHVDAQAFQTETSARAFCLNIGQLEYLIYSVLPRSRYNGGYSMPTLWIPPWKHVERYFGINTLAKSQHNSFEFRYHSGSRDTRKITAWAEFIWELYKLGSQRPTELTKLVDELIAKSASSKADCAIPDTWKLLCDLVPSLSKWKDYWKGRYELFGAKDTHPARVHMPRYIDWRKAVAGVASSDAASRRNKAAATIGEYNWQSKLPPRLQKEFGAEGQAAQQEFCGVDLIINAAPPANNNALWNNSNPF
jgi:hypothetical protein